MYPLHNTPSRCCRFYAAPRVFALVLGSAFLFSACSAPSNPPPPGESPSFFQRVMAFVGLGSGAPQGSMQPSALPVTALEVQPKDIPYVVEVVAQTEGAKETEVRAQVGGILTRQMYQEGEFVKAGQPLFQIDRASYEIAHAEAKARAEQAERELARMAALLPMRGVSKKEFDDADSANKLAQAALSRAELNLSWSTVTAPVSGITGQAGKSVGNLITVGADSLLTVIHQNDPMWVRFSLSENDIAKLPDGKLTPKTVTGVEIVLPDGSTYPQQGKLNFLASSVDTVLGTRQLRAEFPNRDGNLLSGQFVRARIFSGNRQGIFLVPQTAVLQTAQGDLVMTVGPDGKVAPRPIKLGDWYGKDWIVLSGLHAGDQVIIDNLIKLRPGMPVAPHAPEPPPGMPGAPGASGTPGTPASAPKQG